MTPRSSTFAPDSNNDEPLVLVVDDDPDVLDSLRDLLLRVGYRVLAAESVFAAIQIVWDNRDIACVVADQRMPGHRGVVLLDHVARELPAAGRVMFVGEIDADVALASARHTVIQKGPSLRHLIDAIATEIKVRSRVAPG